MYKNDNTWLAILLVGIFCLVIIAFSSTWTKFAGQNEQSSNSEVIKCLEQDEGLTNIELRRKIAVSHTQFSERSWKAKVYASSEFVGIVEFDETNCILVRNVR